MGPSSSFTVHKDPRSQDFMIHVQKQMKAMKEKKGVQMSCSYFREVKLKHSG